MTSIDGDHHFFSVLVESAQAYIECYTTASLDYGTRSAWAEHLISNKQQAFGSIKPLLS